MCNYLSSITPSPRLAVPQPRYCTAATTTKALLLHTFGMRLAVCPCSNDVREETGEERTQILNVKQTTVVPDVIYIDDLRDYY